ncbi:hypothetical protein PFISCL1PPCAC_24328 [Pristionchus fissidentatus]|uniref:Potassium channel domain-containing protein n=1 Tax=Pristionchus fissidentatus TaxID=1538716 RepID=A0AAV5WL72_9BILA|nr:hypothetical protein PFISCL1PPCAC_24328 [Pristionchus fissidentatus]
MGSTGAGSTFHTYGQLIRNPSIHPLIRSPSLHPLSERRRTHDDNNGRVKWEEERKELEAQEQTPKVPLCKKIVNVLKILLPHVGLNVLLLSYITFGAVVFIWLEADNELENRRGKLTRVFSAYQSILNETQEMCGHFNSSEVERRIRPLLSILSQTHEYDDRFADDAQLWTDGKEDLTTRWTFPASVLYALTVITSTGYDHVTPTTDPGRVFTVFFGLLGIPLMFITAADIGKFLSEIVIRSYAQLLSIWQRIARLIEMIRLRLFPGDVDSIDSLELKKKRKRNGSEEDEDEEEDEDDRLQLPVASYFALIIGYCCIGSFLFNSFERGPIWSFIHGVFFSFNTITTIGLGNIQVKSNIYLALAVFYVVIGLAVITASLDLCSSTLKRTFTKLHYFGRKIRGARRGIANMSDDIREAMRIIAALKKTRAGKDRITLEELKRFLEVQEHLLRQPYVPYNVHFFRWIEDAKGNQIADGLDKDADDLYAAYLDDVSMNGKMPPISPLSHKMSSSDPMLFF